MEKLEPCYDVQVYVEGSNEPILASSLILAANSKIFADILSSLNICDGCHEKKCIIITDEEKNIVEHTLNYLHNKSDKNKSDIKFRSEMFLLGKRLKFDSFVLTELDKAVSKSIATDEDNMTVEGDEVAELMSLKTALLQIASEKTPLENKSTGTKEADTEKETMGQTKQSLIKDGKKEINYI